MGIHALYAVPRAWPGETCAVLGAGPSMSGELAARLRGRCRVIAVNNCGIDSRDSATGEVVPAPAPWADVLFASDAKWWKQYRRQALQFAGLKLTMLNGLKWDDAGVHSLALSARGPYDPRPTHVVSGGNSGYQAICVAAHFGATRILLFGFDMRTHGKRRHYFGNHPPPCNTTGKYADWITNLKTLARELEAARRPGRQLHAL